MQPPVICLSKCRGSAASVDGVGSRSSRNPKRRQLLRKGFLWCTSCGKWELNCPKPVEALSMKQFVVTACLLMGILLANGCATKKYVRNTVAPVQAKVEQVGEQTS